MADEGDTAQELAELYLDMALKRTRGKGTDPEVPVNPTGHCFYCSANLKWPRRWCDANCRDYWQQERGK